jgi:hypothetical protein
MARAKPRARQRLRKVALMAYLESAQANALRALRRPHAGAGTGAHP